MGATESVVNSAIERLLQLQDTYSRELESLVENIRWIATLVLAEIAALAAYRELLGEDSLSLPFAVVVLILSLSLVIFLWCSLSARRSRRHLASEVQSAISTIQTIFEDTSTAAQEGDNEISKLRTDTIALAPSLTVEPRWLELAGLALFIVASVIVALAVFITEIAALFGVPAA